MDSDGRTATQLAAKLEELGRQRDRAEAALQDSEQLFRSVMDHAADLFFIHDLQGNMVDVSQVACDSLGYSREELLKLFIWELVPVMPVGGSTEWKDLALDVTLTDEVHVQRKDGTTFPVEGRARKFELRGQELMFVVARDISARKRAEGALAKQSAELAEMATFPDMNPGPVCRLDLDGTIVLANKAARQVFGDERLPGKNWLEICPGMDQTKWKRVLSGNVSFQHETDVSDICLLFTHTCSDDGKHVFVFGSDITDRKRAEVTLSEQAAELAEMATFPDMNPGPVCRLDLDGTIVLANKAARQVFGDERLPGKNWLEICPGMDQTKWKRVLSGNVSFQHETDVSDICLLFTHTCSADGKHVFVFGSDITDRKRAEVTLAEQAAELAEMAAFPDMNPGPVCRLDRDGTIVLANKAARQVFDDERLLGKNWLEICPGMDQKMWQQVLQASGPMTKEVRLGERAFIFTLTSGAEGQYVFVYGTDVTEQQAAERALAQGQKMATLGTLAAGVAHELNNPAAAAQRGAEQLRDAFGQLQQSYLQLEQVSLSDAQVAVLKELDRLARERAAHPVDLDALGRSDREYELETWLGDRGVENGWELAPALVDLGYDPGGLSELADRFEAAQAPIILTWLSFTYPVYSLLTEIGQGAGRVSEIVKALKEYSYLGQAPLQPVDVNQGLNNTLIILRNKLKLAITVHRELAGDLPVIQAYGSELNQVWTNIIDNAADAMNGKGEITVRTYREDAWVAVEIEDDGPGIPKEIQPKIFDAFFTSKAPGEGTGLGLNTSYNIVVQKHHGQIRVDSKPGRTCFIVKLPIDFERTTTSRDGDSTGQE